MSRHDSIKARLLSEDEEFQKLHQEHRSCDDQLVKLLKRTFLSSNEQVQERKLKKQKLWLKDRMERRIESCLVEG